MFVAVLKRQTVAIYRENSVGPVIINFPANLVSNLEVKDSKGLTEFLAGFLKSAMIPSDKGVLLLTGEVSFAAEFPNNDESSTKEAVNSFLGFVPISRANFVSREFVNGDKKWVCVSNRSYCTSIIYGFQMAGLKITMVLPTFTLGVNDQTDYGIDTITRIEAGLVKDKPFSMLPNIFEGVKKSWWKFW